MKSLISLFLPLFFACSFWLEAQAKNTERPSVLLINVDDWNDWNSVLKGHSQAITPNIERFAKRGSLLVMRFVLLRPAYPRVPLSLLGLPRPIRVIFPMTVESVRGAFMPARKPSRFRSCFLKTDGPASVLPKTSTGGMALNLILIFHRSKLRKN